jgi:uncharacterized membrane protein
MAHRRETIHDTQKETQLVTVVVVTFYSSVVGSSLVGNGFLISFFCFFAEFNNGCVESNEIDNNNSVGIFSKN